MRASSIAGCDGNFITIFGGLEGAEIRLGSSERSTNKIILLCTMSNKHTVSRPTANYNEKITYIFVFKR